MNFDDPKFREDETLGFELFLWGDGTDSGTLLAGERVGGSNATCRRIGTVSRKNTKREVLPILRRGTMTTLVE